MILVFLMCALLCAAVLAVAVLWSRRAPVEAALSHEKALYAGFVADLDRREARGDIDAAQAAEERTQAARALISAGDTVEAAPVKPALAYYLLAGAGLLSLIVYAIIGTPSLKDAPYQQRLAGWTALAKRQPDSLPPAAMAAVLRQGQAEHAKEVDYWLFLGRIDMLAGNNYLGAQDYEKARALSPGTFTAWSELGEALTFVANGNSGAEAKAAFEKALAQDPKDARAHYYLGNQAVTDGQYDLARTHYQAALDAMAPDDVSRKQVSDALKAVGPAETAQKAMQARIAGMVGSLEGQLKANPENPAGWARLLRSYDVLGDAAGKARARAEMQAHYAAKPQVIADILSQAQSQVGAENTGGE